MMHDLVPGLAKAVRAAGGNRAPGFFAYAGQAGRLAGPKSGQYAANRRHGSLGGKADLKIVGYDSLNEVYSRQLPATVLSEDDVIALLQRLASRHLIDDEVVSASNGQTSHLEVRPEQTGSQRG